VFRPRQSKKWYRRRGARWCLDLKVVNGFLSFELDLELELELEQEAKKQTSRSY
jgi:hypothetical protein